MKDTQEFPCKGGNGSGTAICYVVQAKMLPGCRVKKITCFGGLGEPVITDSDWVTLSFSKAAMGVPNGNSWDEFARHGYLSYQAAQALRWWWLAEQGSTTGIMTRLLRYEFKYTYEASALGPVALIDPEKREDVSPDWGQKK